MLFGDDENYWRHYFDVIGASCRYIGRQLLALGLSLAPLVVFAVVIMPALLPVWHGNAPVVVVPATAGSVILKTPEADDGGDSAAAYFITPDGDKVPLSNRYTSHVSCGSRQLSCLVLLGLGFAELPNETQQAASQALVVIRPSHDDWNPLWPYLNDAEFLFFISLTIMSVACYARRSSRVRRQGKTHGIGALDFFLTEIAVGGTQLFKRLGDLETRRLENRLENHPVRKPLFITGLARSGTTILLEKISTIEGVATHRYRDFPFIMTPVLWNRFQSLLGSSRNAVERPHGDKIRITRDSPEAFEEPIWQYFFGNLHDGLASDVLDETSSNPEFERFYLDHIRKILFVRRGTRYVSKGNYNVTRINYINRFVDDARFIVPIRHPLTHIQSLVRQHQRFSGFAKDDHRIPEYMRAVGHYEFGLQRKPIVTSDSNVHSTTACWDAGLEAEGYAWQWLDVYRHVASLVRDNPAIAARLRVVRFEDLCADPEAVLERLFRFADLPGGSIVKALATGINANGERGSEGVPDPGKCWSIVEEVAVLFGYNRDPRLLGESQSLL